MLTKGHDFLKVSFERFLLHMKYYIAFKNGTFTHI